VNDTTEPRSQRPALPEWASRLRLQTWLLLGGFFLISHMAMVVYDAFDQTPSLQFLWLFRLGILVLFWYWLSAQCRPHGQSFPMDMGMLLYAANFVLAPYYMWRTQRWRGIAKLAGVLGLYVLSYVIAELFGALL
jgi:hypothetical protein